MNEHTKDNLTMLAFAIQHAYMIRKTQDEAVKFVKETIPSADINVLQAMWLAIDAYVDINGD